MNKIYTKLRHSLSMYIWNW